MRHQFKNVIGRGLFALALAGLPLAGCSTDMVGMSTYGDNSLKVADISNIGDYTADRALSEARAHFRNNDFGYSAALYKRVVELSPNNPEGYVGLGASYDRLRRFDLADRAYAAMFKLTGGTLQYYNNIGYSYMLRGDLKSAYSSFRSAQKLDPGNVVVANNLQLLSNVARQASA
ncbi:MAG TPA: tetratricopeptide repeat protein [Devosiaceae bacterium]